MVVDLTAFAPLRCVQHELLTPHASPMTADATTLFVDVAGFTPLTERLARFGSRGSEELSRVLRGFFASVTDVVLDNGGDPVAYGGDALTIVFDGPPSFTIDKAVQTAHAIHSLASKSEGTRTAAGPVTLTTRIGVARGSVTTAVARSGGRSITVHVGAGLDHAVEAAAETRPGGVLVHGSASGQEKEPSPSVSSPPPVDQAELERLVHPTLLTRLSMGAGLLETHRITTVAFTRFDPVTPDELPAFLADVARLVEVVNAGGGEVLQVSGGDKGIIAMSVFGAPIARDDDPLRAADTMMELRRRQPSVATGIATGPVFTGLVGSERRWFPAVTGPAVNLAARLTQAAAPRDVLVEGPTWRGASGHLRAVGPPRQLRVKGVAGPVEVRALKGWRHARRQRPALGNTVLVGRSTERAAIERMLDGLSRRGGPPLAIEGEPGSGKTRLAVETADRARTRGFTSVLLDAADHPRGRPSGLWRECLTALEIAPAGLAHRPWLDALTRVLPESHEQLPALARLLGLSMPSSPLDSSTSPSIESEVAQTLLGRVIRSAAAHRPLLLVFENVHHLDDESLDVLGRVATELSGAKAGLMVTRRSGDTRSGVGGSSPVVNVYLNELAPDQAGLLAAEVWGQAGGGLAPAWLPEAVVRRAGGNPLLVRMVARALFASWEPGQPPPSPGRADATLAAVLAERIDRLPGPAKQLLNFLAVAQRPIKADLVDTILRNTIDRAMLTDAGAHLTSADLIRVQTDPDGVDRYRILHDVLRDVVYTQLSHAERNRLHRTLADQLAAHGGDAVEVAEHVRQLDDPVLAAHWFPRAARSARASWSIGEAIDWWRLAVPLLYDAERRAAEVELLEVLLIGDRAPEVLALAGPTPPPGADADLSMRWLFAEAQAAFLSGLLDQSEAAARRILALTDGVDEDRYQRVLELLVRVQSERGDMRASTDTARLQLRHAQHAGEPRAIATAHASLGMALLLGDQAEEAAEHYEEARASAAALGDFVLEIHTLSDLAGCRYELRSYADCVELLGRARELAEGIGYRRHLAYNLLNEAELRSTLGDPAAAACAALAVQRSLELGDPGAAANAVHTWVTSDPQLVTSATVWRRLLDLELALGRRGYAAEAAAQLALIEARAGHPGRARHAAEDAALRVEEEQQQVALRASLARLLADAGPLTKRSVQRSTCLLAGLSALAAEPDLSEVESAEIAVERWRASHDERDRESAATLLQSAFAVEPSALVRAWCAETGTTSSTSAPSLPPAVGIGRLKTTKRQFDQALSAVEDVAAQRSEASLTREAGAGLA